MLGIPLIVLISIDRCTIKLVLIDDNGRIAVKRQSLCVLCPLIGWQIKTRVAGRQDGSHGQSADGHDLAIRSHAHGQVVGKQHEVGTFRQRDEIFGLQAHILTPSAPHASHARRIEDIAVLIGIYGCNLFIHAAFPPYFPKQVLPFPPAHPVSLSFSSVSWDYSDS